jgi:hypothetical protein
MYKKVEIHGFTNCKLLIFRGRGFGAFVKPRRLPEAVAAKQKSA